MDRNHVVTLFKQLIVYLGNFCTGRLGGSGQIGERLQEFVEPVGADVNAVAVRLSPRVHQKRYHSNVAGQGRVRGKIRAAVGDDSYGHETSLVLL